MKIEKIFTEYQETPLGLDEEIPRFSWQFTDAKPGQWQQCYRICVTENITKKVMWDTGKRYSSAMSEIAYEGEKLKACTKYIFSVETWDSEGTYDVRESFFETGLMNSGISAWDGAKWIAAPRFTVMNRTRGVFCIESTFRMTDGAKRAGLVFGEGDYRLMKKSLNEYGIEGTNYIRYEINCTKSQHVCLNIYRVGYAPEDTENRPFYSIALSILTEESLTQFHTLRVEVIGNRARAYIDGQEAGGLITLNPRGGNDVLTYPRLNRIGFFAGENGKVLFRNLTVTNIRKPSAIYIDERPEKNLQGEKSVFSEKMCIENDCFVLTDGQVTADTSNTSIPMFRRIFDVRKKIVDARLYITSRGIYDVRINGKEIMQRKLAPGLSQYDKRLHYQTYDVTEALAEGKNGIGVILASGWWSDAQTFTVCNYNYFGDREAMLCKLVIRYEDESREVIVSDTDTWRYFGEGPYEYAGLFLGEQYNAQKADIETEFSKADYKDDDWEKPVGYQPMPIEAFDAGFSRAWPAVNQTEPLFVGGYDAPVFVVEKKTAIKCKEQEPGVFIYDFGQEMAGVPRILFHEPKGTRIYIRYAEMLYPNLPCYGQNAGKIMRENYRDAESTDIYICNGREEGEVYQPKFTYHGFRYVELNGVTNAPELTEVEALQYSSITEFEGTFTSSNELLNRFVENVRWSQLCNFISIPTDCPQRNERMGWAGDTHVFCNTALHNSNLKLFYERNLQAFSDLQEENGRYPEIAPIGGGFGGITYECAPIFIAWELYLQYGDKRVLEKYYPDMKKYMEYMKNSGMPGNGKAEIAGPLADWLAFEETDVQLMWNAFYFREALLMEKMARVLGKLHEADEYSALKERINKFWNSTFVDEYTGKTRGIDGSVCDTQTSYALAIEYEIADDVTLMAKHLARKVKENGYKVRTGFFGTGLLNRALSRMGYDREAYELIQQQQFPSWLYPVTQGATTIWEHWDSYTKENGFGEYNFMNSFNHYSLGSVVSWLYDYVLGIKRLEAYPGYSYFELKPVIGELDFAKGSVASPHGMIESSWEKTTGGLRYTCKIPGNTSAKLILPDGQIHFLQSGSYEFEC